MGIINAVHGDTGKIGAEEGSGISGIGLLLIAEKVAGYVCGIFSLSFEVSLFSPFRGDLNLLYKAIFFDLDFFNTALAAEIGAVRVPVIKDIVAGIKADYATVVVCVPLSSTV